MDAELCDTGLGGSDTLACEWDCITYGDPAIAMSDPIPSHSADAVNMFFAFHELPAAMVLSCGGGGHVMAAEGILNIKAATDEDWRAVECTRVNVDTDTKLASRQFERLTAGDPSHYRQGCPRRSRFIRDQHLCGCLLYTSPSPRDATLSRMPSSA